MIVSNSQFVFKVLVAFMLMITFLSSQNKYGNDFGEAEIIFDKDGLSPVEIRFKEGSSVTKTNYFEKYKSFFGLTNDYEFVMVQELTDQIGQTHYRFNEFYKGVEVLNAQLILHEKNGIIHYANGKTVHRIETDVSPSVTEQVALQSALNHIGAETYKWEIPSNESFIKNEQQDPNATFYPNGEIILTSGSKETNKNNLELAYRFDIYAEQPLGRNYVDVNAVTGEVINTVNRIHDADIPGTGTSLYNGSVNIIVDSFAGGYRLRETGRGGGIQTKDMLNGTNYNAAVDFDDTDVNFTDPNDQAGVSVHWAAEGAYDYYWNIHNRNSFNNTGGTLFSYAHYDVDYNSAFWDGTRMTYGDGDGFWFSPLVGIDVIGHELTHGVTQYSANLIYANEPGALNESFSDIFGTAVEFYLEGSTADWLIGEDCYLQSPYTLRSMEDPNLTYCPDTYQGIYWINPGGPDFGGVHTNSSVQNFWFYLLSVGGSGVNDNGDIYSVTGIGLADAEKIAYRNLTVYLTQTSNFHFSRAGSINAAADLFGLGSQQYLSVIDAWNAVGVYSVRSDFAANITAGQPPLLVQFTDQSIASPGSIISWEWDFNNDGTVDATEQNPIWIYNDVGLYDVTLTVSDGTNTNTLTKVDYVVAVNPGSILVWEGQPGGANYSGVFIKDYLGSVNLEVIYLTSNELLHPLNGFDAVFLSFGNAADATFFSSDKAATVKSYLQSGGFLYLEGGEALGYDQSWNYTLLGLFGIAYSSDGLADNTPITNLIGMPGTLTESMLFTSSSQPDNYWIDNYVPNATGQVAFNEITVGDVAIQSTGYLNQRTFCFSYALGKLNDGTFPSTKENLLAQILDFFEVEPLQLPSVPALIAPADSTVIDSTSVLFVWQQSQSQVTKYWLELDTVDQFTSAYIDSTITDTTYLFSTLQSGKNYWWRVRAFNAAGWGLFSEVRMFATNIVSVEGEEIPINYSLRQNYPNPFNPSTTINFSIPTSEFVTLKVFDLLGNEVATLVNEEKTAGRYEIEFSAIGGSLPAGRHGAFGGNAYNLSSGIYFYSLNAGSFIETKKMILIK